MKETAYLLQGALISVWWLALAISPDFFQAFQYEGISATAFWAFFTPDVTLIAILSILRAYLKRPVFEYLITGAFAYAALYCCNASFLTASGWLPTTIMLIGLAYNVFLTFHESLFRESHSKDFATNAFKTLIQIVCIWVLALGIIPAILLEAFGALHLPDFQLLQWSAIILFAGFSTLGLSSYYFFVRDGSGTPLPLDQSNQLVVSGPYRYIRNPMAVAGIGQGISIAIFFQSLPILVYSLLGVCLWQWGVKPFEERNLASRFGQAYLNYRDNVPCWIPRFHRLGEDSELTP